MPRRRRLECCCVQLRSVDQADSPAGSKRGRKLGEMLSQPLHPRRRRYLARSAQVVESSHHARSLIRRMTPSRIGHFMRKPQQRGRRPVKNRARRAEIRAPAVVIEAGNQWRHDRHRNTGLARWRIATPGLRWPAARTVRQRAQRNFRTWACPERRQLAQVDVADDQRRLGRPTPGAGSASITVHGAAAAWLRNGIGRRLLSQAMAEHVIGARQLKQRASELGRRSAFRNRVYEPSRNCSAGASVNRRSRAQPRCGWTARNASSRCA